MSDFDASMPRPEDVGNRVGVVTVTFNTAKFLPPFMDSCAAQRGLDFSIYCIDNNSKDGTVTVLKQDTPDFLQLTFNADNAGVAAANNQGIRQALGDGCEWILLLNNDTTFEPTLFCGLVHAARSKGWLAVVPKIHFDVPANHLWFAGGHFVAAKGHTGTHVGIGEHDRGQHDAVATIDYAPTCCMLLHRSVFERVGLMDEAFFVYYDDTDFCWRLRQHGIALGYWPQEQLVHKVGGSTGGIDSPFTTFMAARNRLFFIKKHRGSTSAHMWSVVFMAYYVVRHLVKRWNPTGFMASVQGTRAYSTMQTMVPLLRGDSGKFPGGSG